MYNEKFLSIHIPKSGQEKEILKEVKKSGKQREKRINEQYKKDVEWFYNMPEKWQFKGVLNRIEEDRRIELQYGPILIIGSYYISYYPTSDRIGVAEKRGETYSKKYAGRILICGRFEEMFLLELFEAGEMLAKVLWIDGEVSEAEVLQPELILGDTAPETLIDEPIAEDDERYWQKEDFEKIDLFLQKNYHLYADEPRLERLEKLPLLEQSDGIRIYDGQSI